MPEREMEDLLLPMLGMKVRDIIRRLEDDGWYLARTSGSHRQYKHLEKPGTVTVAGKPSVDLPPGTLSNILKQAGLKKEE
jgi:predicted RNA binding protein YcfA (HicA-like mRNA interferase family)